MGLGQWGLAPVTLPVGVSNHGSCVHAACGQGPGESGGPLNFWAPAALKSDF